MKSQKNDHLRLSDDRFSRKPSPAFSKALDTHSLPNQLRSGDNVPIHQPYTEQRS